jgi:methylmalonyl-CoA/ethylmalonyl-CoA epimerase
MEKLIRELDHVSIAVNSIEVALQLYRDVLGGRQVEEGASPDKGFRYLMLEYPGGGRVELIEPLGEASFLHKFLRARGEGLHHVTFKVQSIEECIEVLARAGYHTVLQDFSDPSWKEAFLHPKDAHGVLIQFAETPR